ncbi:MAG: hypothetical protein PVH40_06665 [Gemmatimonadales bacterium]
MDPYVVGDLIIPLAGMLTGVAIIGTLGWTVRHWVNRHYEHQEPTKKLEGEELARLEERMMMLEETVGRLQDLEERMDFTERVLAQQRHGTDRLGAGGNT